MYSSSIQYWQDDQHHDHDAFFEGEAFDYDDKRRPQPQYQFQDEEDDPQQLKRGNSWSSDLVLCEGSSSVADFSDMLHTSSRSPSPYTTNNNNVNPAIVSDGEYESPHSSYDYIEEKKDCCDDDDDFDFGHLMEEEEEDNILLLDDSTTTGEESDDNFEFEPYYDRETNRTIMRLRMRNLRFSTNKVLVDSRQRSIIEEEVGEELIDEEGYPIIGSSGPQHNPASHQHHQNHEVDQDDDNTTTSLHYSTPYPLQKSSSRASSIRNHYAELSRYTDIYDQQQHRQQEVQEEAVNEEIEHASPPLLCASSVTSGSEEAPHHHNHHHSHTDGSDNQECRNEPAVLKQLQQQQQHIEDSEPWRHVIPPPPPPNPPPRRQHQPLQRHPNSPPTRDDENIAPNHAVQDHDEDHTTQSDDHYRNGKSTSLQVEEEADVQSQRPLHESSDINKETIPSESSTPTTTRSSPETSPSSSPQDVKYDFNHSSQDQKDTVGSDDSMTPLPSLYADMIQNQQPIDAVESLMRRDPNVKKRDIDIFLLGVKCMQQRYDLMKKQPSSSTGSTITTAVSTQTPSSSNGGNGKKEQQHSHPSIGDPEFRTSSRRLVMDILKNDNNNNNARRGGGGVGRGGIDDHRCETKTAVSAYSTMSCKELSIQRLQRRFALKNQARKEKEEDENNGKVENLLKELQDAQDRQKRLEKQLSKAGICLAEDIPYEEAKKKVAMIAQQMEEIGSSNVSHDDPKKEKELRQRYYILEQEMEKYMSALELTDEYLQEQLSVEQEWDDANFAQNGAALQLVWRHMPVNIRHSSVDDWLETPTPNGSPLPKAVLKKFFRTNVLSLLRQHPDFIRRSHPSNLESLRCSGLTLTERRALERILQPIATHHWQKHQSNPMTKRKWNWYCLLRQKLKDCIAQQQHHLEMYLCNGRSSSSPCGCPHVGTSRCVLYESFDYSQQDYGYPCDLDDAVYEDSSSGKAGHKSSKTTTKSSASSSSPPKQPSASPKTARKETHAARESKAFNPSSPPNKTRSLLSEIATAKGKNSLRAKAANTKQQRAMSLNEGAKNKAPPRNSLLAELQLRTSQKLKS